MHTCAHDRSLDFWGRHLFQDTTSDFRLIVEIDVLDSTLLNLQRRIGRITTQDSGYPFLLSWRDDRPCSELDKGGKNELP